MATHRWVKQLLLLSVFVFVTQSAHTQNTESREFVRVNDVSELTTDDEVVIAYNFQPKGASKGVKLGLYVLSAATNRTSAVTALCFSDSVATHFTSSDSLIVWKITVSDEKKTVFRLCNASLSESLRGIPKTARFELSKSEGTSWEVTANNGQFNFRNVEDSTRFLSFSYNYNFKTGYSYNFIHSTKSIDNFHNLIVFKLVRKFTDVKGDAVIPQEDGMFALSAKRELIGCDLRAVDSQNFLLENNRIARADNVLVLKLRKHSSHNFTIENSKGLYLNDRLVWSDSVCSWVVTNGYIQAESSLKYLLFNTRTSSLCCVTEQDALGLNVRGLRLASVEAPAEEYVDEKRIKWLRGGWTVDSLAAVSFEGVAALDLSSAVLPIHLSSFHNKPQDVQIAVVISEKSTLVPPSSWGLVVRRMDKGFVLNSPYEIKDKLPLVLPFPVTVKASQLSYTRDFSVDGGWETLSLPFDALIPSGFEAARLKGILGDVLHFEPVTKIERGHSCIIRPKKIVSKTPRPTTFYSLEGELSAQVASDALMRANFVRLSVEDDMQNLFFLNKAGDSFVRVGEESVLHPFRAYLKPQSFTPNRLSLPTELTSGVNKIQVVNGNKKCYSIDGRKVLKMKARGVYIMNKQKLLIK